MELICSLVLARTQLQFGSKPVSYFLFPGLDPTKLGPRPGTESNLSPGPNPNKLGHGPGTESTMSPGLDPTAVWSQAWIRSQPVPRPGPSSVTGLDPKSELKGSIELIGSYHI